MHKQETVTFRVYWYSLFILGLLAISFGAQADQTGDCTSGTQYCEDNGLTTINNTVTYKYEHQ